MSMDSLDVLSGPDPIVETSGDPGVHRTLTGVRNVLLDADDTLWENNIFFLASLDWLCTEGRALGSSNRATISLLNHWENFNIAVKGYGYDSYHASLTMTIRALVARSGRHDIHGGLQEKARRWTNFLKNHPIQWCPGVYTTLPRLVKRFRTIIVTKGHPIDQMNKVIRCGLMPMFHGVRVVPHKYPSCYLGVLRDFDLKPEETVMVGNSPRSDINMARRAGLRTVYIPHRKTWFRELEPISTDAPETVEITSFDKLLDVLKD